MVQQETGMAPVNIDLDWAFIQSHDLLADWQFYHDCWFVDGEKLWDAQTKTRVNKRYMAGQATKDPFAIDNQPLYTSVKLKKERRILNA